MRGIANKETFVNIFDNYEDEENKFTNSLIALLKLLEIEDNNITFDFLSKLIGLNSIQKSKLAYNVLKGIGGKKSHPDSKICNEDHIIIFETKKESFSINKQQLINHLNYLKNQKDVRIKKLILLTPDNSGSCYVDKFIEINNKLITHLSWKKVYEYFDKLKHSQNKSILFNGLVQEFLDLIKQKVFESDYVGGILKIDFGDESGIYSDTYLEEIRNHKWKNVPFHTPQQHHVLDGTGRKLLLYDKERFKITIEAEIEEVYEDKRRDKRKTKYIYANKFKGDPKILEKPIPLNKILKIPKTQKNVSKSNKDKKEHGFINFNKRGHRGIWDLTQTQYDY